MKTRIALILFSVCAISGSFDAFCERLYPVQGPLAGQTPPPMMNAKFSGTSSGKFTIVKSILKNRQNTYKSR
jgi:hypothetical protein